MKRIAFGRNSIPPPRANRTIAIGIAIAIAIAAQDMPGDEGDLIGDRKLMSDRGTTFAGLRITTARGKKSVTARRVRS